jgi:phosphatidylglycerol:prolipoprotein diacylglycerol transferase
VPDELAQLLSQIGLDGPELQSRLQAGFYALAVGSAVMVFLHRSEIAGFPWRAALGLAIAATIMGIAGSRVFYLVETGAIKTVDLTVWWGLNGTASWGAYTGVVLALFLGARLVGQPVFPWLDLAAGAAAVGFAIGRLACLVNGDDFGIVTQAPWALHYTPGSLAYTAHLNAGMVAPEDPQSLGTHPLQLYLALEGLLVFLIASRFWFRHRRNPGVTLEAFLLVYGVTRLPLEFLRDPAAGGGWVSTSMWMCLGLIVLALALLHRRRTRAKAFICPALPAISRPLS